MPTSVLGVALDAYLLVALLWAAGMWRGYNEVGGGNGPVWRAVKCAAGGLIWFPVVAWVLFLLLKLLYKNIRDY